MRPLTIVVCGFSMAAGCWLSLSDQTRSIAIAEPNELGVVSVEVERYAADGNDVFALRAFTADHHERAFVQLTRGDISGLSQLLPGETDTGAELVVLVDGAGSRMVTRELERYRLEPSGIADPAVERFLGISEIASTLDREANISLAPRTEQPYSTSSCAPEHLNTTPVAEECCAGSASPYLTTMFHRADQTVILKSRNPNGIPCTAADGISSCSGAACYFGPNAFARPQLYAPTNTYAYIYGGSGSAWGGCGYSWAASDPAPVFPNIVGTFPTNVGCPVSGKSSDGAGDWDY